MNTTQILYLIALIFDAVALGFVLMAGSLLLYIFLKTPKKKGFTLPEKAYTKIRSQFVHRIILSLDFFIVADLLKLAFAESANALLKILLIVIIRTVLSYFLLAEEKL